MKKSKNRDQNQDQEFTITYSGFAIFLIVNLSIFAGALIFILN